MAAAYRPNFWLRRGSPYHPCTTSTSLRLLCSTRTLHILDWKKKLHNQLTPKHSWQNHLEHFVMTSSTTKDKKNLLIKKNKKWKSEKVHTILNGKIVLSLLRNLFLVTPCGRPDRQVGNHCSQLWGSLHFFIYFAYPSMHWTNGTFWIFHQDVDKYNTATRF